MPLTPDTAIDLPAPVQGGIRWATSLRDPREPLPENRDSREDRAWQQFELEWRRAQAFINLRRQKGTDTPTPIATPAAPEPPTRKMAAPPEPNAFLITSPPPPPEGRVGDEYIYHARARDADTIGFTWHFEQSPPGMAVDRHTGAVTWTPTNGGWFTIILRARTVYGRETSLTWTVCIRKAAVIRTPKPNPRFTAALWRKARRAILPFPSPRRPDGRLPASDRLAASPPAAPPGTPRPRTALPPPLRL